MTRDIPWYYRVTFVFVISLTIVLIEDCLSLLP